MLKIITLKMPEELIKEIEDLCRELKMGKNGKLCRSEFIRRAVIYYIETKGYNMSKKHHKIKKVYVRLEP